MFNLTYVPTSGTALDGTASENARRFDPEKQKLCGLWGQNFGGWYIFCGGSG